MTTEELTTAASPRPRTLQDDLLADLRQAAPMPVARPEEAPSAPLAAERPQPTDPETPTIAVRVTPRHWAVPSLRPRGTGSGFVVTAGPVQLSVAGFRR